MELPDHRPWCLDLGLEAPAARNEQAVKRTAPMAMFLYSLTIVWYAKEGHADFLIPDRP